MFRIDGSLDEKLMIPRSRYQGVLQILAYNRGFYLGAIAVLALLVWAHLTLLAFGAGLWILISLAVSHFVYDRSALYSLDWLDIRPVVWLNVHAGLDETTALLARRFAPSSYRVFDVFDPAQMTEPSIAAARRLNPALAAERVSFRHLPAAAGEFAAIFVIFAAHEFRKAEPRHAFFAELARVLQPGGALVIVEHLRDVPNFLAYGPGSLHFQSRRTWLTAFHAAHLTIQREYRVTPFVRVFELAQA